MAKTAISADIRTDDSRVLDIRSLGVVSGLVILAMITYADRTAISTAKDAVATELSLSDSAMGLVFGAFALGYAAAQIPAGWMADKFGPRAVLGGTVAMWSLLTVLAGTAWSFASLVVFLFLFGAGEAAVFPGSARAIRNWLAPRHRGRANGALFAGSRVGAALAYPLLVWMIAIWKWRVAFFLLGSVGLAWAAAWLLWFRNMPPRGSSPAERDVDHHLEHSASSTIGFNRLTPVMMQYFASNFTNFIGLSWMLPYLKAQYGLSSRQAALASMIPLLFGATSQGVAGALVDRLFSSPMQPWSRRIPAMVGFLIAALGLAGLSCAHSVDTAVLAFTCAVFGADMTISPSWVFCADIAGERTGQISGAMNMFGSIGAFLSANAFPFLNRRTGSSSAYFLLAAGLDLVGVLCWISMRSVQAPPLPVGLESAQ
jgi:ACS family glucarate transporter-like MFS transporter